uniref:Uncharacterized protein n=1 Tax=Setaria italica TaxID=4555 RepID=K3XNM7_SETIT
MDLSRMEALVCNSATVVHSFLRSHIYFASHICGCSILGLLSHSHDIGLFVSICACYAEIGTKSPTTRTPDTKTPKVRSRKLKTSQVWKHFTERS